MLVFRKILRTYKMNDTLQHKRRNRKNVFKNMIKSGGMHGTLWNICWTLYQGKRLIKRKLCFELVDLKLTDYLLQKRRKKRGAAFIPNLYRSTLTLAFA